ncbi:tyrosine-type recombinase/integrase [Desulfolutivibrio sulfoxidireducens]|uniref:tyrosine-type recombinase/integrase n=1 Tax=Desulfolutivibrio sulfoxidireducens TaxID=2773299 RepID=UPI00159D3D17|nr:integrase arm-type DNA-binding domain-containing protein [Desulfolutivibrio sulfoxidireducens]QLA16238.1 DUF4102 domain-containing protein [Desulfolutivibrio sulfoxidireducens]
MLTNALIKNAKPKEKGVVHLKDGRGLYMEITPACSRRWRFRYWIDGRENRISLGLYPEISLAEARKRCEEARRQIAQGVDPSKARQDEKAEKETFELVAREWLEKFGAAMTERSAGEILRRLERDVFPWVGSRPINAIAAPEFLSVVRRIESRGAPETARRCLQYLSRIGRYAVATGRATRDSAADLRGCLPPANKNHFATLTDPKDVAQLLRDIEGYQGSFIVLCALKLSPLLFVRPGELRGMQWSEIDLEAREWRIPACRMKMKEQHIVPLAPQAIAILDDIRPLTGHGVYVFPSLRGDSRPMSNNTVNSALRRLGYEKDQLCAHGFRSMASTLLNEMGWNGDVIEKQLAHGDRDKIRASYNVARYLPERKKMMDAWASYLDSLKSGAKVTPLRREAGGTR